MSKKQPLNFKQFPCNKNNLAEKYVWQVWILKTSGTGIPTTNRLFYSWIVPTYLDFKGWQFQAVEYVESVTDDQNKKNKIELLRADYYGSGTIIRNAILELFSKQLSEIVWDEQDGFPPDTFLNLTLASFPTSIYVVRPEVMMPNEHLLVPWSSKAIPSPVGYSIFVSQIVNLDKVGLITFQHLRLDKKLIRKITIGIAKKIQAVTGFDFTRSSAPRIGNIEWYRLPISDKLYRPLISCSADNTGAEMAKGVIVYLNPLPEHIQPKNISISCRIINGEEVTFDELRDVVWENNLITEVFVSEQPVCDYAITIWENGANSTRTIIFEDYYTLLRQIGTNMSIIGSVINSGRINMLDKLTGKEEKDKPVQLAKYHRSTHGSRSLIGGYETDPWVDASRESIQLMKKMFPEKSGGHFFINGWDENKGASGQLSFVEWMFDIISGDEPGGLILIDPYFDTAGLEIFSNARTTNTHFRILTCTQHRDKIQSESSVTTSKINASSTDETVKQHATELANACEKMRPLLQGLHFYLLDLKSKAEGKKQLFHDRYMLLTDASGIPKKGFHFSNSIQGATRNEPLLITPIPEDILTEVLDYVESLIDSTEPQKKQTEIITLYPVKSDTEFDKGEITVADSVSKINKIPNASLFFSTLFRDISLLQSSNNNLQKKLIELHIYDEKDDSLLAYNIAPEHIESLATILNASKQEEFAQLMGAWGDILAWGQSYDQTKIDHSRNASPPYDVRKELATAVMQYPSIAEKLVEYLNSYDDSKKIIDHRERLYDIFKGDSFEESFTTALRAFQNMPGDFFTLKYSLMYAAKLLVYAFPAKAIQFLDTLITQVKTRQWNEGDSGVRSRLLLITTMASIFFDYHNRANIPLQAILLNAKIQSIRTASCVALHSSLSINYHFKPDVDEVLNTIQRNLPDDEYRMSLAYFISSLQLTHREDKDVLQTKLFKRLLTDFKVDEHIVNRTVCVLGGWLKYDRSIFITTNFLNPLVNQGKISSKEAYKIWHEVFLNKVRYNEKYNGSEDDVNNFSSTTDKELTVALLNTFLVLEQEDQHLFIKEWINAVEMIWPVINQPFAQNPNYDQSAIRLFWVSFMIKKVYDTAGLSDNAAETTYRFIDKHKTEIESVNEHVRNMKYIGIHEIENILTVIS